MNIIFRKYMLFHPVLIKFVRQITMSQSLSDEALKTLKSNPYYNKYSSKILEKQKRSTDEFNAVLEEQILKKRNAKQYRTGEGEKPLAPGEAKSKTISVSSVNSLDKIMKVDLINDKTKDEIKQIWEKFHKMKECVLSATIPTDKFKLIQNKAKKHPVFLFPLPRNQGYEFIMLQMAENEVHFTPLISYQTHKENASECLTIIYYPQLIEKKDIVLMRGEFDKNVINPMEAQCLANQLQLFYGECNEKRDAILHRFTYNPDEFIHMDLVAEIECLSL